MLYYLIGWLLVIIVFLGWIVITAVLLDGEKSRKKKEEIKDSTFGICILSIMMFIGMCIWTVVILWKLVF